MDDSPFSDIGKDILSDSGTDDSNNSLFVVFCYVPVLCLVPILRMGLDDSLKFHAKQGLVLFLLEIIAAIFLIPPLNALIWQALLVVCIGSSIAGALFALQGKRVRLPIIGDLADKIKL